MLHVTALEVARRSLANTGAALAAQIVPYIPANWPAFRYSEATPDGAFQEDTIEVSANAHPGETMLVPDWTDVGGSFDFGQVEGDKTVDFAAFLFPWRSLSYIKGFFTLETGEIFAPFGSRYDTNFSDGRFPRDEWKAGSIDLEKWGKRQSLVAENVLKIILEFDRWNEENEVLAPRSWTIAKLVQGVTIQSQEIDYAYAEVPELLEDVGVGPASWHNFPAYTRIGNIQDSDPTWVAADISFGMTRQRYEYLLELLVKADFVQQFYDDAISIWRHGSQRRRGP